MRRQSEYKSWKRVHNGGARGAHPGELKPGSFFGAVRKVGNSLEKSISQSVVTQRLFPSFFDFLSFYIAFGEVGFTWRVLY